jgi:non-ribosomal peptide synthetase component F
MERSLEILVGLLGILKAGGAYVPLDAAYPTERLALMLEDTQIRVLLTKTRLVKSLLGFCSINTVIVIRRLKIVSFL